MGDAESNGLVAAQAQTLTTDEELLHWFDACIDDAGDDAAQIAKALGTIVYAKAMNQLARDTGISLDDLYRDLSGNGSIELSTVLKVTKALGLQLGAWSPTIKEPWSPCFKPSRE